MSLAKYFRLWAYNFQLEIASDMAYKLNFYTHIIGNLISGFVGPLIATLIYSTTPGLPGWSYWEFILFQGTFLLVWGLAHSFIIRAISITTEHVRNGTFDKILLKPFRPFAYLLASAVSLDDLATVVLGGTLVIVASKSLHAFNLYNVFAYLLMIVLALVFFVGLVALVASLSFFVVKSWGVWSIFETISEFSYYPLTIYSPGMMFVLSFILPAGLASFYPAAALLGKIDLNILWKLAISVFAFLAIGLLSWHNSIKRYSSAGG